MKRLLSTFGISAVLVLLATSCTLSPIITFNGSSAVKEDANFCRYVVRINNNTGTDGDDPDTAPDTLSQDITIDSATVDNQYVPTVISGLAGTVVPAGSYVSVTWHSIYQHYSVSVTVRNPDTTAANVTYSTYLACPAS